MDEQIKELIKSFKDYRELLSPLAKSLNDVAASYDETKTGIESLTAAFGGDLRARLNELFEKMSKEAQRAADLASQADKISLSAEKFTTSVLSMTALFQKIESRLSALNDFDTAAKEQIKRLDAIIAERAKGYNLKELQASLDGYNRDIRRIGEFLNKDIADTMIENSKKLEAIKYGLDGELARQRDQGETLESLLVKHNESAEFLKRIIQSQDVNEAYLFEILDRWAEERRIKLKR